MWVTEEHLDLLSSKTMGMHVVECVDGYEKLSSFMLINTCSTCTIIIFFFMTVIDFTSVSSRPQTITLLID